jgi:hypothetical protein
LACDSPSAGAYVYEPGCLTLWPLSDKRDIKLSDNG